MGCACCSFLSESIHASCKPWLKPVDICNGCVRDECTSGRQPDCCVSFLCDATNGQCIRAFRATGAYTNISACAMECEASPSACTGSSANLTSGDCHAWQHFSRDPHFSATLLAKCPAAVLDPCSCTFYDHVQCADGRITHLNMNGQSLAGPFPASLLKLAGLTLL